MNTVAWNQRRGLGLFEKSATIRDELNKMNTTTLHTHNELQQFKSNTTIQMDIASQNEYGGLKWNSANCNNLKRMPRFEMNTLQVCMNTITCMSPPPPHRHLALQMSVAQLAAVQELPCHETATWAACRPRAWPRTHICQLYVIRDDISWSK